MKKLSIEFYKQPATDLARLLLGKFLVRRVENGFLTGKITETEAYHGFSDRASHAFLGKTARNEPMFYEGGHIYVYMVYGMYYCFNVVAGEQGFPSAVLVRSVETIGDGLFVNISNILKHLKQNQTARWDRKTVSGPGRLCRYFEIGANFNKTNLNKNKELFIVGDESVLEKNIKTSKRVGIDYAGKYWSNRKWRFCI